MGASTFVFFLKTSKMGQLTIDQRRFIIEEMVRTNSVIGTLRNFKKSFNDTAPTKLTIRRTFMKWKSEGTVQNVNKGKSGRNFTKRTTENNDLVKSLISTNDMNSTRKLAAETNISRSSIIINEIYMD